MRCDTARSAISARLDGELPADEVGELDAHLASCPACLRWQDEAADVTRRARVRPALPPGPDLSARVLAQTPAPQHAWPVERWLLLVVGATMLVAALPAAVGAEGGHLLRDAGITDLALAVGVLSAAWQPWRAAGVLPVVVVLAAGLTVTGVTNVVTGQASALDEAVHTLAPTAALLLWLLRRRTPRHTASPPATRLTAVDDERRSA